MNPVNPIEEHPTAFTKEIFLTFNETATADEMKQKIRQCISEITYELKRKDCRLIGHIKGMIDAGNNGHLFFSTVTFDGPINIKGTLSNNITNAKFILNVIVYGADYSIVEDLANKSIYAHLG